MEAHADILNFISRGFPVDGRNPDGPGRYQVDPAVVQADVIPMPDVLRAHDEIVHGADPDAIGHLDVSDGMHGISDLKGAPLILAYPFDIDEIDDGGMDPADLNFGISRMFRQDIELHDQVVGFDSRCFVRINETSSSSVWTWPAGMRSRMNQSSALMSIRRVRISESRRSTETEDRDLGAAGAAEMN